jgi:starch synthase
VRSPDVAFEYDPDGFETVGPRLMGRQAAGEGLLAGYVRHSGCESFLCFTRSADHAQRFADQVRAIAPGARTSHAGPTRLAPVANAGTLLLAGPRVGEAAWLRRFAGERGFSICGLTHTTASHTAMSAVAEMAIAPVQPWDALICTSRAVIDTVTRIFDVQEEHLRRRLGATRMPRPRLAHIPLGIDVAALTSTPDQRSAWRSELGIPDDAVAILSMARLSYHAKAHPAPLYMALEEAARATGADLHLILAGWFANPGQERVFREGCAALAPSITLHVVDGRTPRVRREIWAAADIFTLMSDNIQETFGLAPVEGMAAGLPVVTTDWNGIRDTIEHGVTGFRIATIQPPPGHGLDLARWYEAGLVTYDAYVGAAAQFCAFDVGEAAAAFAALAADRDLRQRMGNAGRQRALDLFDWSRIVSQYQALWADLDAVRRVEGSVGGIMRADRIEPFAAFRSYPTRTLDESTIILATPRPGGRPLSEAIAAIPGAIVSSRALPPLPVMEALMEDLDRAGSLPAAALLKNLKGSQRRMAFRALAWLCKHGLLRIQPE